jgi:formate dehydrogenase major subunit/NADH-quinone oxidoreductase subunit G
LNFDPNRCVLCGKCIYVCRGQHGQSILTFARRGLETSISAYGASAESTLQCEGCRACMEICPVRAITMKSINY